MAATHSGVSSDVFQPHTQDYVKTIEKALTQVEAVSGNRLHRVFEDWLELTEASLRESGRIQQAALQNEPHTDSEETQKTFERLRAVYPPERGCFHRFSEALGALLSSAADGYQDVVGSAYRACGWPSKGAGQYFTPWNVARVMAHMTMGNVSDEVNKRLKEAIGKSPLATGMLLAGVAIPKEAALSYMVARVIPHALEHYDPVTVYEPCIGSGIMFLAAASVVPHWMIQMGLVQFYGQDVDFTCVRMAKINSMLYGLSGIYATSYVLHHECLLRNALNGDQTDAPVDPAPSPTDAITPHLTQTAQLDDPAGKFIQLDLLNVMKEPAPVYLVV